MNILSKTLKLVKQYQNTIFLTSCLVLVAVISFNLGKLNSISKSQLKVSEGANIFNAVENNPSSLGTAGETVAPKPKPSLDLRVVASKNSDKYHFLWCSGAKRIKEENKLWFSNETEAQKAGYTLAGNCNQ